MALFQFLTGGSGRQKSEVLEENYSAAELRAKAVIRDERGGRNQYLVFDSWAAAFEWVGTVPAEDRAFHEIVFGGHPQKLKFDVDADSAKLGASTLAEQDMEVADGVEELLEAILTELHAAYGPDDPAFRATRQDLLVFDSSGALPDGGWKGSYHVLYATTAVANCEEAKYFTARVLAGLTPSTRALVDAGVNKSLQSFRLAGSAKPGSRRVKLPTQRFGTALPGTDADTTVGASLGARVLPRRCTVMSAEGSLSLRGDGGAAHKALPAADEAAILKAAREAGALGTDQEFLRSDGGLLLFRRLAPSYCQLCDRTHDQDNTFMLAVLPPEPAHGGGSVRKLLQRCRKCPGSKLVAELVSTDPPPTDQGHPRPRTEKVISARLAALQNGRVDPQAAVRSRYNDLRPDQQTVYSAPKMAPYETVRTLSVHAQMGVGKTKALCEYIAREYPPPGKSGVREPVMRFFSFRQTFSLEAARALPGFALYTEHPGDLDHLAFPRLIVQVESLHRLPMPEAPEPVDLLILDEVESILGQFGSGLHRNLGASFAMFAWMVSTAERLIALDANLSDRTFRTLERLRGGEQHYHHNLWQQASKDTFLFSGDREAWLAALYERLAADQKAVVALNSVTEAHALAAELQRRFPTKTLAAYSGKTPPSEKSAHFGNVHAHWNVDILLYTPTVSAGVSYELEHFDVVFGYFGDQSCDVETCRQMLRRVRSVRTQEYIILLAERPGPVRPTEPAELQRQLEERRAGLYRRTSELLGGGVPPFDYGPGGAPKFQNSNYLTVWLENLCRANLSRNGFIARFIDQVAATGAQVGLLPGGGAAAAGLGAELAGRKKELAAADAAAVAAAPELPAEAAAAIQARMERQLVVAPEEQLALRRYQLAEHYARHGRPMDAAFVATYARAQMREIYANLSRIGRGVNVADALGRIQYEEGAAHWGNMELARVAADPSAAEARDLQRRYVFHKHYLALWLLQYAGFRCLTDTRRQHTQELLHRFRVDAAQLQERLPTIANEFALAGAGVRSRAFGATVPDETLTKNALRLVNQVLRRTYGLEVRSAREQWVELLWSAAGRAFEFRAEPPPVDSSRPWIYCALRPPADSADLEVLDEALAALFYGSALCAPVAEADPDPGF